jgi:uncharacterized protein (DUF362 family)
MERNEILITYGDRPGEMAVELAEAADLAGLIGDRNRRVGLKPNLVVSRPASGGATTHPEIAGGLITYLQGKGFRNLVILEGSWAGDNTKKAFDICGYRRLAEETGVELLDTKGDETVSRDCKGMNIDICKSALAIDFLINLPVMKGHCQTQVTCALKNAKGLIPDREKRRFHSLGLDKPIAHLNTVIQSGFILVDGLCGDLDFEEGGNPVPAGRLFAARDPVLCDAWAASLMGYSPGEIPYIRLAEDLGVGSADLGQARVRELHPLLGTLSGTTSGGSVRYPSPAPQGKVKQLAAHIRQDQACSPCYAGLIFALSRLEVNRLREPIAIGQGFRGKPGSLGVGQCCSGFRAFCPGCPPSGADILRFLRTPHES